MIELLHVVFRTLLPARAWLHWCTWRLARDDRTVAEHHSYPPSPPEVQSDLGPLPSWRSMQIEVEYDRIHRISEYIDNGLVSREAWLCLCSEHGEAQAASIVDENVRRRFPPARYMTEEESTAEMLQEGSW